MATERKALITGITGQDGSYLAELLLEKGYEVHGLIRRSSRSHISHAAFLLNAEQKKHTKKKTVHFHYADLTDTNNLVRLIAEIAPDEVYNLAAQSHVKISFDIPFYTSDVTGLGALRLLEAIRQSGHKTKFYQAASSEMFGRVQEIPQKETTPFYPRSPYGVAKVFAYWTTVNYREAYNIFACNGILFNHESPRRGENFVTRKITIGIAEILAGKREKLLLGNLDASRDWGYAPEYVEAMWRMLQQPKSDDYVIATGETHTVKEFLIESFRLAGIDNWKKYVEVDKEYYRPTEVDILVGDASKARKKLGWKPKATFKELVHIMLEADCQVLGVTLPKLP